ncbi:glycosyltransferase family 2 protein [bacterium]|nr:glycosyltransferase family 2 protein [bacterium]
MFRGSTISVILPTFNEKDSIRKVIEDFDHLGIVEEIIVINNNAAEGTSEEVAQTKAIEIIEPDQGYGSAIQRGFREAKGDLLVVCEPDDTFLAKDIYKFLAYVDDLDIIYGTRTTKNLIWEKANMGFLLRWGNWAVAKLLEILFNTNYLSDVGCTYRLVKREVVQNMLPYFKVKSNFFGPEMMVLGFKMGYKCVQIPVNYKERVGISSVTGDIRKAIVLGIQMIFLILFMRLDFRKKSIY